MAVEKLTGKPTKEGVYFTDLGGDIWDVVVVEEHPASSELHCPIHGDPDEWPEGDYFGPVDIDDIKSRESLADEIVRAGKLLDTLIAHRKQTVVELNSIRKHLDVLTQSGHTNEYDWNADPERLSLIVGEIYGDIQHVLDQLT